MLSIANIWDGSLFLHIVCFAAIQPVQTAEICKFFDRKVDELDKAISVASRDPSWYGIDELEIENRRRWTSNARTQVSIAYARL
jgi:hypothetical protein